MRHRLSGRRIGRSPSHRRALKRNLALSILLRYEGVTFGLPVEKARIRTTLQKAKEVRSFIERLVSLAVRSRKFFLDSERLLERRVQSAAGSDWASSNDGLEWRKKRAVWLSGCRRLFDVLRSWDAVRVLVGSIAEAFERRRGGYLRIVRIAGSRLGDAAKMAYLEFVGSESGLVVSI